MGDDYCKVLDPSYLYSNDYEDNRYPLQSVDAYFHSKRYLGVNNISRVFYPFLRQVCVGLIFMYSRNPQIILGDLRSRIRVAPDGLILISGVMGVQKPKYLKKFFNVLPTLRVGNDAFLHLDSPLFYNLSQGCVLMLKLQYLVFQLDGLDKNAMQLFITPTNPLSYWVQTAINSQCFRRVVQYIPPQQSFSKFTMYASSPLNILKMFSDCVDHWLHSDGFEGYELPYYKFKEAFGDIICDLREVVIHGIKAHTDPEVREAMFSYLDSSHSRQNDKRVVDTLSNFRNLNP